MGSIDIHIRTAHNNTYTKPISATMKFTLTSLASASAFVLLLEPALSIPHAQNDQTFNSYQNSPTLSPRQVIKSKHDGEQADPPMEIKWYKGPKCTGPVTVDLSTKKIKYGVQYMAEGMKSVKLSRDTLNNEQLDFSTRVHKMIRSDDNSTFLEERGNPPTDCSHFIVSAPVAPQAVLAGMYMLPIIFLLRN